ncbi:MAG: efflux RND transporter periplasmic adaptor subunit [Pseudomonadota bacterium]
MKKLLILILITALAAGAYWMSLQETSTAEGPPAARGGPARAVPVTLATVTSMAFQDRVEAIGTTRANESVTITAKVTDKISSINFVDGQSVDKGQLLVELTNDEQTAQLAEAKADLEDARRQLRRVEELAAQGTVAASQVDELRARASGADARLEAIVARLKDRVIRAPFAGVLGFRQVSPGTLVSPGTAITTLDDVSRLKLDFSVPELYLQAIDVGDSVIASSPAFRARAFEGIVAGIDSRIDEITRAVTVRADIPNEEGRLRPGMLMTVELQTAARTSLAVPEASVVPGDPDPYVYVVNDNTAARRDVKTGQRSGGYIEILEGLESGDRIVVLGLVKLRDGATVSVVDQAEG